MAGDGEVSKTEYVLMPQCIIFDFDYTLGDSSRGHRRMLQFRVRTAVPAALIERSHLPHIGMSLPHALVVLAGQGQAERAEEFQRLFLERADEVMHGATRVFEFVSPMVTALTRRGIALGIVSTKFRARIETVLRREFLSGRFAVIVGGDDVTVPKPHPSGLLRAASALGCDPEHCLYVGDSVTDAETARRAGVPFAAVLSGVTERVAFEGYEPSMILDCAGELPEALGFGM